VGLSEMLVPLLTGTASSARRLGLFITIFVRTSSLGLYRNGYGNIFILSSLYTFATKLCRQEQDNIHSEALYCFLITKQWSKPSSIMEFIMIGYYITVRSFFPFVLALL
jgi:hypothetical protein